MVVDGVGVDRKDLKRIKENFKRLKNINSFGTTWYSRTCFQDKYDDIEKNVTFDITQNNVSIMCPEKIVGHIANTYFWSH